MGWLREQRLPFALVGVLGAAAVALTLAIDWVPYRESQPVDVARVAAGDRGALGGAGFRVLEVSRIAGSSAAGAELEVAEDAVLLVARLEVEPGDAAERGVLPCTLKLVEPGGGVETRWATASFDSTSYRPPEGVESFCPSGSAAPFELDAVFVLPADAAERVELEISDLQELPRALRLELAS